VFPPSRLSIASLLTPVDTGHLSVDGFHLSCISISWIHITISLRDCRNNIVAAMGYCVCTQVGPNSVRKALRPLSTLRGRPGVPLVLYLYYHFYLDAGTVLSWASSRPTRILREFIEALELKNLTLVLHDWGGPIGLEYAVYHRENVKKLVLLNTLATVDFKLPWVFKAVFRSPFLSDFLVRGLNVFGLLAFRFGVRQGLTLPTFLGKGWLNSLA